MPTVLVADDDVSSRDLIHRVLDKEGVQVVAAATGAEAIATYCRRGPALVLLDLDMPGINGFEFLRWLGSEPEPDRAPVIVLTASSDRDSVRQAAELGASGYVIKPFDVDNLKSKVRGFLGCEGKCALV